MSRIVLFGQICSIQASWVKPSVERATAMLNGEFNDLGGVLMNEGISRAAAQAGHPLRQRTKPDRDLVWLRRGVEQVGAPIRNEHAAPVDTY